MKAVAVRRCQDTSVRPNPLLLASEIDPNIWDSEQLVRGFWWDHGRRAWWVGIQSVAQLPPDVTYLPGLTERRWIRYASVHDAGNARREGLRLGQATASEYPPAVPFLLLQLVEPSSPLLRWVAECTFITPHEPSVPYAVSVEVEPSVPYVASPSVSQRSEDASLQA